MTSPFKPLALSGWLSLASLGHEREFADHVRQSAAVYLATLAPDLEISTTDLAKAIWPASRAPTAAEKQGRQRLFKVLARAAERELAAYCHRGEPVERLGMRYNGKGKPPTYAPQTVRPWLWHSEREPHLEAIIRPVCPHCGGEL